jgi:hypothetical protein
MSILRPARARHRILIGVALAATLAAVATATVTLTGSSGHRSTALGADINTNAGSDPSSALCSAPGPGGAWTITSSGVAILSNPGTAQPPCTQISLPDNGQNNQIQQCAAALAAARQQVQQEAANVLFGEFIKTLIDNNAQRWASDLVTHWYQGPSVPAGSAEVSDAVNNVAATDYDLVNAVSSAFKQLMDHSFDIQVDCAVSPTESAASQWKDDTLQRLADGDTIESLLGYTLEHTPEIALDQIASLVADSARAGLSPDDSLHQQGTTTQ